MDAASTTLTIQLLNNTGGGVTGVYVAQVDVQITSINAKRHLAQRPSLQYRKLDMVMAGAIGAGYWNHQGTASNTLQAAIWGDIQCLGLDVHEATAPITAGYDVHTIYAETVESDGAPILFNTFTGEVTYTPPAALMINGGAEPGARVWCRCRGVATGAGVDGTLTLWAWVLAI
jgi:hypothetical protein